MTSRKRPRDTKDEDDTSLGSPPSKKLKCLISSDPDDYKEFTKYVDCIQNSPINELFNIPSVINREISEYCMGELEPCSNDKCDVNICLLSKDIKDPDNQEWIYCYKMDKYFCEHCKPSVIEYECGTLGIKQEKLEWMHMETQCDECGEILCYGGCNGQVSGCICCHSFCDECMKENPSLLVTCIKCDDSYCDATIDHFYKDYDKICFKCNQFVCGKCLEGRWESSLAFDGHWDSFHCLKEEEQKKAKELICFMTYIDPKLHPKYDK